jgi:hypothetical protein
MVQGAMVLLRGVQIRTLKKLLGCIVVDGCNSTIVPENETDRIHTLPIERQCFGTREWDMLDRTQPSYFAK